MAERPVLVENETELDKEFFENLFDMIAEASTRDTGWRKLRGWTNGVLDYGAMPNGMEAKPNMNGGVFIRRVGPTVMLAVMHAQLASGNTATAVTIPSEFGCGEEIMRPFILMSGSTNVTLRVDPASLTLAASSGTQIPASTTVGACSTAMWPTRAPWPATLPGAPV